MAICDRKDCYGLARWMPALELRAKGHHGAPAKAVIGLRVCTECRQKTKLDDLMTDDGWKILCDSFRRQGKQTPTRKLTKIHWKEVPNAENN